MSDDKPTLYERTMGTDWEGFVLPRVTIVKSRYAPVGPRWWAFAPPDGNCAIHAPTQARVLELAEREWGKGSD